MTERSTVSSRSRSASPRPTDLFNGYVGSCVVYALQDVGLLAALRGEPVHLGDFASRGNLEPRRLRAMAGAAARLGYLSVDGDRCELTEYGERLCEELCYFTCTLGGYGELFLNLAEITRGDKRFGVEVPQRLDQVARGRQQYSRQYELEVLGRTLEGIDAHTVVDLASGDGSFLLFACGRSPSLRAFGVDLDAGACERARSRLRAAGFGSRAAIIESTIHDVIQQPAAHPELAAADLVTSFALLHHLVAAPDGPGGFLRRLRAAFPNASHFLFSDITAMTDEQRLGEIPIFSLAYELFHVFMDIEIRPHEAYLQAFEEAGLRLVRHNGFGQPNDQLYLLAPAD
jgi:hypothetical protein